jgi:hypothetical protein
MKTEGDTNILCIHSSLWTFSQWKSIKIISGMNLMSTSVISHHIIMSIIMYIRGCNWKYYMHTSYRTVQRDNKFVSDNITKERNQFRIWCILGNCIISCMWSADLTSCNSCLQLLMLDHVLYVLPPQRNSQGEWDLVTLQPRHVVKTDQYSR